MNLYEPIDIGGVTVPNRIVKSAMAEGRCDERGRPKRSLSRLYGRWSKGGVGLAITGIAHVREGFGFTGKEIGLYDDSLIEPLKELTAAVHEHPGKIFAQLNHAPPQVPRRASHSYAAGAPSAGFNRTNLRWDPEIPSHELATLVTEFGEAGRRAREAGFDGVQLHAAHGYLLSRMLSPRHNRRDDMWGGCFRNRFRLLEQSVLAIQERAGADFPVAVKLNAHDGEVRGGLTLDESVRIGRRLQDIGVCAIEVSAGTGDVGLGIYPTRGEIPVDLGREWVLSNFPFLRPVSPALPLIMRAVASTVALREEAFFEDLATRFAEELDIPVICVGGIRTRVTAERLLRDTPISMVSLARPLVREFDLPNKWRQGIQEEALCTSCNKCFVRIGMGSTLKCRATPSRDRSSPSV